MPSYPILAGWGKSASVKLSRRPPSITRLTSVSRCVNISGPVFPLPMSVVYRNGTQPIRSSPTFPLMMTGSLGCCLVQIYGGLDSELLASYPMSSETELPTTLKDFICDYGAMEGLTSNNAKSETSFKMKDLFRMYIIKDKQSEPHYQHQNPIERRIQDLKLKMHGIMDRVRCPPPFWLLCLLYVIHLLNVLSNLKGCIPLTIVMGTQTDISPYLDFHFWQEVFVEVSGGGEQLAHWCGPSHKQGDFLTYFVLLEDTQQLVTRSNVRYAKDPLFPNQSQCPAPLDGDTNIPVSKPIATTIQDHYNEPIQLPMFSPDELLGMTILRPVDDELVRAKVVRKIMDRDAENHQQIKFLLAWEMVNSKRSSPTMNSATWQPSHLLQTNLGNKTSSPMQGYWTTKDP